MPNIHINYLNHHLARQLNELYVSTVIFSLGQSIITLFVPIYLYQLGFALTQIITYFIFHYLSYAILLLLSGNLVNKLGYEKSIGWSIPLYGIYLGSLFLIPEHLWLFYISALLWSLYKSVYWPAFHADFSQFGNKHALGEEISLIKVFSGMISLLGPVIGGFILTRAGFSAVFFIAMLLSFVSLIPLFISKEKKSSEKFSSKTVLANFSQKKYRNDIIANLGSGEDTIAQIIWPIFLLTILNNYQDIGAITTIALFITFCIMLFIGKLANKPSRQKLIKITSSVLSAAWIIRIFSFDWSSLFAADTIYKISKSTLDVPVSTLIYSRPLKNNVLNYIIFKEISLAIGKMLMAIIALAIIIITGQMILTFVAAAIITLLYFYWNDKITEEEKAL